MGEFSGLITVDRTTLEAVESLGIPGINTETMLKVGQSQRLADQERAILCDKLGIGNFLDGFDFREFLRGYRPEVLSQLKKKVSELSTEWHKLVWLYNKYAGFLLIDGMPKESHPLYGSIPLLPFPKFSGYGPVNLAVSHPGNPMYCMTLWQLESPVTKSETFGLPKLERVSLNITPGGQFPLRNDGILVLEDHSFLLVKSLGPWEGKDEGIK